MLVSLLFLFISTRRKEERADIRVERRIATYKKICKLDYTIPATVSPEAADLIRRVRLPLLSQILSLS